MQCIHIDTVVRQNANPWGPVPWPSRDESATGLASVVGNYLYVKSQYRVR